MGLIVHQVTNQERTNANGQVPPITDRRWYDYLIGHQTGVAEGCNVTLLSGAQLSVAGGWGIIQGCLFTISQETVTVQLSTGDTLPGRLLLQVDTATNTGEFVTQAANPLPALIQEDINSSGTIYQMPLATYQVNSVSIVNGSVQNVSPQIASFSTNSSLAQAAVKLQNARTIRTDLGSTNAASFDGSSNVSPGVSGVLPVANGGSGLSSSPSMLINLGSTTAANVMQASPRPGVTGTLPVGHGGTGLTSSPSMLINLGSTTAANVMQASPRPGITGTLGVAHGGTGQTSVANIQAGKDGSGNTITSTYLKLSGGTMTGELTAISTNRNGDVVRNISVRASSVTGSALSFNRVVFTY